MGIATDHIWDRVDNLEKENERLRKALEIILGVDDDCGDDAIIMRNAARHVLASGEEK
jgi:hypothetical protein